MSEVANLAYFRSRKAKRKMQNAPPAVKKSALDQAWDKLVDAGDAIADAAEKRDFRMLAIKLAETAALAVELKERATHESGR